MIGKILGISNDAPQGSMALIEGNGAKKRGDSPAAVMQKFKNWPYRCASLNGSTVASVPLRLFVKGAATDRSKGWYKPSIVSAKTKQDLLRRKAIAPSDSVIELTEHPVLDLLRLANPREVGFTLIELTTIFQEMVGNAYWYMEPYADPIRAGQPMNLWNLFPQHMKVVPTKDGKGVMGYLYGTAPKQIAFKPEEIIHFRYPNPNDALYGLGPAQAGIHAIDRKAAMDEYKQAMYDNHCRPDFVITVPEDTTPAELESLQRQFKKMFKSRRGGGVNIVGKPWVTTGDKKIETLSFQPRQMQDIDQAKLDRDEICQMFGVPITMLEISKSRAEAEAGEYGYMLHTIEPRLRRMEQFLNENLAAKYDPRLFFAFDDPVPENREALKAEVVETFAAKLITKNEGRQALGYDPVDGGDEFPAPVAMPAFQPPPEIGDDEPKSAKSFLHRRNAARARMPV